MLKKALLGYIAAILFISLLVSVGLAKAIDFRTYAVDDGSANHNAIPPSFYLSGGTCTVNSSLYATATYTGPFYLSNTWYSPDSTAIYTSLPFSVNNITCDFLNTNPSVSASNNSMWESGTSTTTAATANTYLINNYDCQPSGDFLTMDNKHYIKDSFNYFPFGYRHTIINSCSVTPAACSSLATARNYIDDSMARIDCGAELAKDIDGSKILSTCTYRK